MWRRSPSKLSKPAAANVLALTTRSSERASPHAAATSSPRRPSPTPLAAECGAIGARVGATREPVGIETDHLRVPHQIAPAVHHLDVVAAPSQLLGDTGREAALHPEAPRGLAPRAPEEPARRLDRRLRTEPPIDHACH